jgi:hypothetical protein
MIDQLVKIHDNYSVEIKLGLIARKKKKVSEFAVNTWLFIPNSLDINPYSYDKKDFYRDIKTNIRLITPVFLLRDIVEGKNSPLKNLQKIFSDVSSNPSRTNIDLYEYQIKMFCSIMKSALRDETNHIINNKLKEDTAPLLKKFSENIFSISKSYREFRHIINVPTIKDTLLNFYLFGDEFMSNVIEQHAFRLLEFMDSKTGKKVDNSSKKHLIDLINREIAYKSEKKFPVIKKESPDKNREFALRMNILKKYVENVLFLSARKKRDGIITEQVYYSLAAGISMIFATAIAFSIQMKYGNFTMPLFVALVVSYMLKDRIKELGRYYFVHQLGHRFFDHKTHITLNSNKIGWSKEAMDFISDSKVPEDVIRIRNRSAILEADNRNRSERIILFRKLIRLNRKKLEQCSEYNISGINEIIRLNISSFTNKMDNPDMLLHVLGDEEKPKVIRGEKTYFINLIMQLKYEEHVSFVRYRLTLNREGIKEIERF